MNTLKNTALRGQPVKSPVRVSTKLHPLHDPAFVARYVTYHGEYPGARRTGRSTARALAAIAYCIDNPGVDIVLRDHCTDHGDPKTPQQRWFVLLVQDIINKLGLKAFNIDRTNGVYHLRLGDKL